MSKKKYFGNSTTLSVGSCSLDDLCVFDTGLSTAPCTSIVPPGPEPPTPTPTLDGIDVKYTSIYILGVSAPINIGCKYHVPLPDYYGDIYYTTDVPFSGYFEAISAYLDTAFKSDSRFSSQTFILLDYTQADYILFNGNKIYDSYGNILCCINGTPSIPFPYFTTVTENSTYYLSSPSGDVINVDLSNIIPTSGTHKIQVKSNLSSYLPSQFSGIIEYTKN